MFFNGLYYILYHKITVNLDKIILSNVNHLA